MIYYDSEIIKVLRSIPSERRGDLYVYNGASQFPQYSALLEYVKGLPAPLMPALENLVFGQSYDDVKRRVNDITGNYLFIDFGEFSSSRDSRNSILDQQKLAATIAMKLTDSADMIEVALASDITLSFLHLSGRNSSWTLVRKIALGWIRYPIITISFLLFLRSLNP